MFVPIFLALTEPPLASMNTMPLAPHPSLASVIVNIYKNLPVNHAHVASALWPYMGDVLN